jgi:DNA-binding CsgD family transcriptional regulator
MIGHSRELRLAGWERQFGALLAGLDLHAGNLAASLERADALLEEALDPLAAQQVGLTAALALVDLGRHEEAATRLEPLLATAADDVAGRGDVLWVLAEAALWGGRPLDALRRVGEYRAYEGSEYPNSHLVDVTAAWAASEAGRPIPAPIARTVPVGMTSGARFERQAVERLVAADPVGAASAFDAAATAWAGFHRRGELRSRWAAAEARRLAGDGDAARSALSAVELDATTDGFRPLVGRIHRSLRLVGVRRATRGPAIVGAARLTAREREVADLVAHGLSNVEIARRLGVGRPTVARLLGSAMAKLGVDSRAQVASVAAR